MFGDKTNILFLSLKHNFKHEIILKRKKCNYTFFTIKLPAKIFTKKKNNKIKHIRGLN